LIAFLGDDSTVQLWDIESKECLHRLAGHWGEKIQFSPDGDQIATIGEEKTRLWDVASGQCLVVLEGYGQISCIAWSLHSDVNYLMGGFENGSVAMWQMMEDGDLSQHWREMNNELCVKNAWIQDTKGSSQTNRKLLKQRGAVGEPYQDSREADKKVITGYQSSLNSSHRQARGWPELAEQAIESHPRRLEDAPCNCITVHLKTLFYV